MGSAVLPGQLSGILHHTPGIANTLADGSCNSDSGGGCGSDPRGEDDNDDKELAGVVDVAIELARRQGPTPGDRIAGCGQR